MENVPSALHYGMNPIILAKAVAYCGVWPIVIICGIFGNLLSLVVFFRSGESTTTSKFLKSLVVADAVTLIMRCLQMILVWEEIFWPSQCLLTCQMSPFLFLKMSHLPERISKGITVAIVFDRVVAVTIPLRYKIICRPLRINATIVMVYIVAFAASLPHIVDVFQHHIESSTAGGMANYTYITEQYKANLLSKAWLKSTHIFNLFAFDFIPIPLVMICNIIIIISLRKNRIVESTTNDVQQQRKIQERKITKLLLTISVLFLALCGPRWLYSVLFYTGFPPNLSALSTRIALDVIAVLNISNNSINFIAYAMMNKKYRKGYMAILCFCRRNEFVDS